ncbi:hypothetical protein WJX72_000151 [[Myrmecia] bisecta]|uniref:Uncharacterized protein n=1 Tax=[Myrmecia] bisecta TaxID=41462 RepID=A0AAW1R3U7_9CHLO
MWGLQEADAQEIFNVLSKSEYHIEASSFKRGLPSATNVLQRRSSRGNLAVESVKADFQTEEAGQREALNCVTLRCYDHRKGKKGGLLVVRGLHARDQMLFWGAMGLCKPR